MAMQQITIPEMQHIIYYMGYLLRQSLMFWGAPGVGKTHGVVGAGLMISTALSLPPSSVVLCDVRLGQYDSVDMRGIPIPDHERKQTTWYPPQTLPFEGNSLFPDDVPIILFLDEITSSTQAVYGVAYQLWDERRVGEHKLKPNVIVVAAGNREGDRGVVNRMPLPLCNRAAHFEVVHDVNAWCNWAQDNKYPGIAIAYMQFRPSNLHTFDPKNGEKVFATPRTWQRALDVYMDDRIPDHIKHAGMAGWVGEGPAVEFWAYHEHWQKVPSIDDIKRDPMGTPVPSDSDASLKWATAVKVSGHMDVKNITPLNQYLMRMSAEMVALAWNLATRRDKSLYGTNEWMQVAKTYKAIYQP